MSFDFNNLSANAGSDGIVGPFINWQARVGQHAQAETWTLRSKHDDNSTTVEDITAAFQAGVIFDYNTLKLGWEHWAPQGQRGEVRWAPTPNLQSFGRPDDTKRVNGLGKQTFNWQKVFAIRVALSPTVAASWNQSAYGAMVGFEQFIDQLKIAGPQHVGKLPKVQFTGVTDDYGGARVPTLTITDWMDAPDCLKQADPAVAAMNTGGAAAPAQASPAVQQAQPEPQPVAHAAPVAAQQSAATAGGF